MSSLAHLYALREGIASGSISAKQQLSILDAYLAGYGKQPAAAAAAAAAAAPAPPSRSPTVILGPVDHVAYAAREEKEKEDRYARAQAELEKRFPLEKAKADLAARGGVVTSTVRAAALAAGEKGFAEYTASEDEDGEDQDQDEDTVQQGRQDAYIDEYKRSMRRAGVDPDMAERYAEVDFWVRDDEDEDDDDDDDGDKRIHGLIRLINASRNNADMYQYLYIVDTVHGLLDAVLDVCDREPNRYADSYGVSIPRAYRDVAALIRANEPFIDARISSSSSWGGGRTVIEHIRDRKKAGLDPSSGEVKLPWSASKIRRYLRKQDAPAAAAAPEYEDRDPNRENTHSPFWDAS